MDASGIDTFNAVPIRKRIGIVDSQVIAVETGYKQNPKNGAHTDPFNGNAIMGAGLADVALWFGTWTSLARALWASTTLHSTLGLLSVLPLCRPPRGIFGLWVSRLVALMESALLTMPRATGTMRMATT